MTWDPAPPAESSTTRPWWDATRERRLIIQRCMACDQRQHYPRPVCLSCGGSDLGWDDATGVGRVVTFSVVHRSPDPSRYDPPYTIGLVDLDEGPRLFCRLAGDAHIGGRVRVVWHPLGDGRHLPWFATEEE